MDRLVGSSHNNKSGLDGSGQPLGFIWAKFQAKPPIRNPFSLKFDVIGPHRNFVQAGFGLGLDLDVGPTFGRDLTSAVASRKLAAGAFFNTDPCGVDPKQDSSKLWAAGLGSFRQL